MEQKLLELVISSFFFQGFKYYRRPSIILLPSIIPLYPFYKISPVVPVVFTFVCD